MHIDFENRRKKKYEKYGKWHEWYAWYPVWEPGHIIWLEKCERKLVEFFGPMWMYRPLKKDSSGNQVCE